MSKDYVTQIDGAYRITGTRISLDSVVYVFLDGQTPECIAQSFPLLTLEMAPLPSTWRTEQRLMSIWSRERWNSRRFANDFENKTFPSIRNSWHFASSRKP
jgi:hypothetical protein